MEDHVIEDTNGKQECNTKRQFLFVDVDSNSERYTSRKPLVEDQISRLSSNTYSRKESKCDPTSNIELEAQISRSDVRDNEDTSMQLGKSSNRQKSQITYQISPRKMGTLEKSQMHKRKWNRQSDQIIIFNEDKFSEQQLQQQFQMGNKEGSPSSLALPEGRRNGVINIIPPSPSHQEKSKFNELIFEVRMKNKARKLANSTNSRMLKNLSFKQYSIINDKSYDSWYQQKHSSESTLSGSFEENNKIEQTHKGTLFNFLRKIDSFLPVFDPRPRYRIFAEGINLLAVILIFYAFTIIISFKFQVEQIIRPLYLELSLCCILINSLLNLFTGIQVGNKLVGDRQAMIINYFHNHFYPDILCLLSTLFLIILDKVEYEMNFTKTEKLSNDCRVSDYGTIVRFVIFLPIFLKVRDFSKFVQSFEEKVIFQPRMQNYLQLLKLFSSIVLIDHVMACLWIFVSKISFNADSSWQTKLNVANDENWFKQYTYSFYFSTVTMTTVGYGDITPNSELEHIFIIFMMLISSGVFGYTLNRIGTIFSELYADEKETRRKLNIINLHMERRQVPPSLRTQIREYLDYVWKESNEKFLNDSEAIIQQLNDVLKKELQLHQNKKIIDYLKVHYSDNFIQKAMMMIQEVQCKPQQIIYSGGQREDLALYFVEKGKVEVFYKTRDQKQATQSQCIVQVLTIFLNYDVYLQIFLNTKQFKEISEGEIFCIDQFYTGESRRLSARATGFANLLRIKRDDFLSEIQQHPEDKEAFCNIRDRIVLLSDRWKANSNCYSCHSFKHKIEDCPYLHFVPNRLNLCLRNNCPQNNILPQAPIHKYSDDDFEGKFFRQNLRTIMRYDLALVVEQITQDYAEDFEEYEQKYLSFDFNYEFITRDKKQPEDDEDFENNDFYPTNYNKPASVMAHFQQNNNNNEPSQLNNSFQLISSTHQIQSARNISQLPSTPRNNNNSTTMVQSSFKDEQLAGNRSDTLEVIHNGSSALVNNPASENLTDNQQPVTSDITSLNAQRLSFQQQNNRQKSPSLQPGLMFRGQRKQPSIVFHQMSPNITPRNYLKQKTITAISESQEKIHTLETKLSNDINYESNNNNTANFNYPMSFIPNSLSNANNPSHLHSYQQSSQNSPMLRMNIQKTVSSTLQKYLQGMMQNMEKMAHQSNPNNLQGNHLVIADENKDFLGQQQIFRNFDKFKNFDVYFQHNNFNFIMGKLFDKRKNNNQEMFCLDWQTNKRTLIFDHSSPTQGKHKYDKSKQIYSERLVGLSVKSLKQKTLQMIDLGSISGRTPQQQSSNVNVLDSPGSNLSEKNFNMMSIRNSSIRQQALFSRNDISLNDLKFSPNNNKSMDISPTLKESVISLEREKIQSIQIESNHGYFSDR